MGTAQNMHYLKNKEEILIRYENKYMKRQILCLKKRLNTIKKRREKSSNVTIFDRYGNNFSQIQIVNELEEDAIIKEHVTSLSKDNKNALRDDNVENLDDKKNYK